MKDGTVLETRSGPGGNGYGSNGYSLRTSGRGLELTMTSIVDRLIDTDQVESFIICGQDVPLP